MEIIIYKDFINSVFYYSCNSFFNFGNIFGMIIFYICNDMEMNVFVIIICLIKEMKY